MLRTNAGQSLIEVLVATTGLVFVLVAVVAGFVFSVRNTSFANDQSLATKYAQEGIEVFRRFQNELGWPLFYTTIRADGSTFSYCMAQTPQNVSAFQSLPTGTCSQSSVISGTDFTRQLQVTVNSTTEITVVSTVVWPDGQNTRQAIVTQVFRERQK